MADPTTDTHWLDLADALTALRDQLVEAQVRAALSPVKMSVDEVTVEFALELQRSAKRDGAFRFGVVSGGAGGEQARRATHRVSLKLSARTLEGGSVDVNDEDDDM